MTDDRRTQADLRDAAVSVPARGPCLCGKDLVRFYSGEIAEADADRIRDHLAACRPCLDAADEARCFVESLRGERAEPVAPTAPAARRSIARLWPVAAAAALFVVAIVMLAPRPAGPHPAGAPSISVQPAAYVPRPSGEGAVFRAGAEDAFARAMEPYVAGRWEDAQRALERYAGAHPADDEARFYLAVARLLLARDADAWTDLERLSGRAEGPLLDEVRWYRALAALRTGRVTIGEAALREIAAGSGPHRDDARQLARPGQAPPLRGR